MRETWYKLESGEVANPDDVITREDGRLEHVSGELVAMRSPGVPFSVSVDQEEQTQEMSGSAAGLTREMVADKPKKTYKRRSKGAA
jgi:hypothetical protein